MTNNLTEYSIDSLPRKPTRREWRSTKAINKLTVDTRTGNRNQTEYKT